MKKTLLEILTKQANERKLSKSIYDEAKDNLTFLMYDELEYMRLDMFEKVKQALERAQKQEKLLKLYRELVTVKDDMLSYSEIVDVDYYDSEDIEAVLEKQIKELENEYI